MGKPFSDCLLLCSTIAMVFLSSSGTNLSEEAIDFNRDIRPILSDSCFKCHGPDAAERHADLRLDTEQGIEDAEALISPGDSQASELYRRIVTDDHDLRMPPPDSGRILSDEQKDLLKRWIDSGAQWQNCLLYTSPSPRDRTRSRMPSSA